MATLVKVQTFAKTKQMLLNMDARRPCTTYPRKVHHARSKRR